MDRLTKNGKKKDTTSSVECYKRLAQYEDSRLSPEDVIRINDFEQSQCAKLLAENGQLKAQIKLMWDALMCLPGAMGATVTQEVCKICLRQGDCLNCLIDMAIREGAGG